MRARETYERILTPERRERVAVAARAPFIVFLEFCASVHYAVKEDPKKRRISLALFYAFILTEAEIHVKGFLHFAEGAHWWDMIPIGGVLIEMLKHLFGS